MKGMLAPQYREEIIGHAEVRSVFKVSGVGMVAGAMTRMASCSATPLSAWCATILWCSMASCPPCCRFKDDVKEVAAGYECGVGLENYNDIKENDEIECFIQQEIER